MFLQILINYFIVWYSTFYIFYIIYFSHSCVIIFGKYYFLLNLCVYHKLNAYNIYNQIFHQLYHFLKILAKNFHTNMCYMNYNSCFIRYNVYNICDKYKNIRRMHLLIFAKEYTVCVICMRLADPFFIYFFARILRSCTLLPFIICKSCVKEKSGGGKKNNF